LGFPQNVQRIAAVQQPDDRDGIFARVFERT
jgi:hypothetical protein